MLTTPFDSPSCAPAEILAEVARGVGLPAEAALDVDDALRRALESPGPAPHVVICGSLHFMGDVLARDPATWPR